MAMEWNETLPYMIFGMVGIFWFIFMIQEIRRERRKAPDGKVFIKEFVKMTEDIYDGIVDAKNDKNVNFITSCVHKYTFKVRVEKQAPYNGLEYETIPMYKNYTIYIDDEVVCRVHLIHQYCKDNPFIEFSSKRNRDEVIEILQYAHVVANAYNNENLKKWLSKYDSKSFYQDCSSSEE